MSISSGKKTLLTIVTLGVLVALAALVVGNLGAGRELAAVPSDLTARAEIPGMPGVRYWVDVDNEPLVRDALQTIELARSQSRNPSGELPFSNYLALSGGGDGGAFGAGLLIGWTKAGTRPPFKVVTGVSTGALIAPFAFLGPRYDATMAEIYTGIGPNDVSRPRNPLTKFLGDSLSDPSPLRDLIARYISQEVLNEIGREWTTNRRWLLVGTTSLDSRQAVIWNIGKIAASGHPDSLELFRSVLLASASIPAVFPPVMFDVEVEGRSYQEMHVDGATTNQLFLGPEGLSRVLESHPREGRALYIIRNASLSPSWASTEKRIQTIATRAIQSLIHSQGVGNLYKVEKMCLIGNIDYNLAFIGPEFQVAHPEQFDTQYMRALYDYGYNQAENGYPWKKNPPELGGWDSEVAGR